MNAVKRPLHTWFSFKRKVARRHELVRPNPVASFVRSSASGQGRRGYRYIRRKKIVAFGNQFADALGESGTAVTKWYWLSLNLSAGTICRPVFAARRAILCRRAAILYARCTLRRRLVRTLAFLVVFGALAVVAVGSMLQRPSNLPLVEPSPRTGSNSQPLAPSEQPEAASEHVAGVAAGTSRPVPLAPVDDPAARLAARLEPLIGERSRPICKKEDFPRWTVSALLQMGPTVRGVCESSDEHTRSAD